jgi:hypothetical protein
MKFMNSVLIFVFAFLFSWNVYGEVASFENFYDPSRQTFIQTDFWESMQYNQVRSTDEKLKTAPVFSKIEETFYRFSSLVRDKYIRHDVKGEKEGVIPKIIHFIWLGSDIPLEVQLSIDSWKLYHPSWEIRVWRDEDIEHFVWTSEKTKVGFCEALHYAEKADILRYEILYKFGGIYSDTDVICLKPFDDLQASGFEIFAGIEVNWVSRITKNPLHVGSAIIGCKKGCEIMKYCLDHLLSVEDAPEEHILNRVGPGLLSKAFTKSILEDGNEKVLLLPISYFYPFPFEHRDMPFRKALRHKSLESMALHLWKGSWLPKEELEKIKQRLLMRGYIREEDLLDDTQ